MKRITSFILVITCLGCMAGCTKQDKNIENEYTVIEEETQLDSNESDKEENSTEEKQSESKEVVDVGTQIVAFSIEQQYMLETLYPDYLIAKGAKVKNTDGNLVIDRITDYIPITSESGLLTLSSFSNSAIDSNEHVEIYITSDMMYYSTQMPDVQEMISKLGEVTAVGYCQGEMKTCYIKNYHDGLIDIDPFELITDPNSQLAKQLGLSADDILDCYIYNPKETTENYELSENISFLLYNHDDWNWMEQATEPDFRKRIDEDYPSPYRVLIVDGKIILIVEQYLP